MPPRSSDLPALADVLASARVVALPLVSRFRGISVREAMLLQGPEGWSEFSPFLEYGDAEASTWLAAALDFGWSRQQPPRRRAVSVNATLPAVTAAEAPAILDRFPGCRTIKVKVAERGQTLVDDVSRVAAARAYLGDAGRIRVDANGAWSLEQAERALGALREFRLEYAEQPCATIPELAELRARLTGSGIAVAADESIRKSSDPLAVARAGAADVLVIKAQPLGGSRNALAIVADSGLPAVVSSALETSVGISMGAYLAARMPQLAYDCGLATAALLAADVTEDPLVPVDGAIPVRRVPVSAALLEQHAAAADRTAWWRARLERCYGVLARARRIPVTDPSRCAGP